jgi:hypothetical protein
MFHMKKGSGVLNRSARTKRLFAGAALIVFSFSGAMAVPHAAQAQERESAAKLVARTMANPEFRVKTFRGGEWLGSGDYYLALDSSGAGSSSDIVRYG